MRRHLPHTWYGEKPDTSDFGNLRRYVRLPGRRAARIRSDVDDELRLHLEMRVAEQRQQGLGEEAARVEAMRQFGDLEDARRDPLTLAAIAMTLGATALAAIAIPARRAADLDPASVLKG